MSLSQTLGMQVQQVTTQRVHVTLTVSPAGVNLHGTAHGGLIFSLADEAFALISNMEAQAVAVETHLSLFQAAQMGDVLHAIATPERVGRTLATYRVEVRRGTPGPDGDLLALFLGTVSQRPRPAADPA